MNLRIQKPSGLGLHPGKSLLGVVGDATRRRDLEHQLQRKDDDDDDGDGDDDDDKGRSAASTAKKR